MKFDAEKKFFLEHLLKSVILERKGENFDWKIKLREKFVRKINKKKLFRILKPYKG